MSIRNKTRAVVKLLVMTKAHVTLSKVNRNVFNEGTSLGFPPMIINS